MFFRAYRPGERPGPADDGHGQAARGDGASRGKVHPSCGIVAAAVLEAECSNDYMYVRMYVRYVPFVGR